MKIVALEGPLPEQCDQTVTFRTLYFRCQLPQGHAATHQVIDLIDRTEEWASLSWPVTSPRPEPDPVPALD